MLAGVLVEFELSGWVELCLHLRRSSCVVVLLSAVWFGTCNWRFEVKVKVCFGERVLKVKMWRKVEIPKKKPFRSYEAGHAHIWTFALQHLATRGLPESKPTVSGS